MAEQSKNTSAEKPLSWFEASLPGQGKRQFGFVPIQILLDKRVSKTGLQVFLALTVHADAVTGLCGRIQNGRYRTPAGKRLAAIIGLSERSIGYGLENLIKTGWICKRVQRMDNSLVLWLGMPKDLDLAKSDGAFKDVPESWTDAEMPDEKTSDAIAQEYISQATVSEEGYAYQDLEPLLVAEAARKERKKQRLKGKPVAKRAPTKKTNNVPVVAAVKPSDTASHGGDEDMDDDYAEAAIDLQAEAVSDLVQAAAEALTASVQSSDDAEYHDALDGRTEDLEITLDDALWDYVRNYDDGGGAVYKNYEIGHFGFTHLTPFLEVYSQHRQKIDAIRNSGTLG